MQDEGRIARNVRLLMEAKGLGSKALSLRAGLNETYVRDILKGKSRNPRHEHLQKLAAALGCRVIDLTDELDPTERARADWMALFDAMTEEQRHTSTEMVKLVVRPGDPPTRSLPRHSLPESVAPQRLRGLGSGGTRRS